MKSYNNVDMKGRLHNYALELKETDKGEAISGTVTVEVDEDGTLATARFYARPKYNSGKVNKTYGVLEDMMAGNYQTVADDGPDADWIAMTGNIDVSYFVGRNNSNSDDDLVRSQKIRGGFLNPNRKQEYTNKWKLDFIITKIVEVDEDMERKLPRLVRVIGLLVDDYNGVVKEVVVQARAEKAMDYIAGLSASDDAPYFVSTWGSLTRITRTVTRENAFGDAEVDEYESVQWVITGMNPEPYDISDENVLGDEKLQEFKDALETLKQDERDKDGDGDSATTGSGKDLAF